MARYRDWNQALVCYFTSGIPRSTKVYLSVDEDILERVNQEFNLEVTNLNSHNDFLAAVRQKVIFNGQVKLDNLQRRDSNGFPHVAFLGATVLAAYEMADEEEISNINYFRRLQKILGLPGSSRPPGMISGSVAEEPLWQDWNRWLIEHGFLPSAQRGRGGQTTYINYPISQSLLRRADKDRLLLLFSEKQWTAQWDAQTLFAYIRREAPRLSKHLKELLTDNRQRYEAVAEAIHEVYQQWQNPGRSAALKDVRVGTWSRHIFAGLYRTEDPFLGQVDYYLYPKQLRGRQLESIQVQCGDNVQLRNERPGWYFPLERPLTVSQLDGGTTYRITLPSDLDSLILPVRDFWILVPDPDSPDTGTYASWGQPPLGTQFLLLCKKELLSDINRLRDERLLEWSGEPTPVFNNSNWVELYQCMVVSPAWDGVFITNQALKDALQPSVQLSISFSSGLRIPKHNAWIEGYGPLVTVFGFYPTVQLQIIRLSDNFQVLDKSQSTNTPISIDFPGLGDYLVKATCQGESTERFIRIIDWTWLSIEKPQLREITPIALGHHICGSLIEET